MSELSLLLAADEWAFAPWFDYGLPCAILAFVGFCLWRAGRWSGKNVVKPVSAAAVALMNELQKKTTESAQFDRVIAEHMVKNTEAWDIVKKAVTDIRDELCRQRAGQGQVETAMCDPPK